MAYNKCENLKTYFSFMMASIKQKKKEKDLKPQLAPYKGSYST